MKKRMFEELLQAVKEGGEILRGERKPSRVFVVALTEDMKDTINEVKKKAKKIPPKEYAKECFEKSNISDLVIATMGGHIKAEQVRAQMKHKKMDIKYFQEVLDEFDELYKTWSKKKKKKS